jgi:tetratricopeptide (TPR) repeat protein
VSADRDASLAGEQDSTADTSIADSTSLIGTTDKNNSHEDTADQAEATDRADTSSGDAGNQGIVADAAGRADSASDEDVRGSAAADAVDRRDSADLGGADTDSVDRGAIADRGTDRRSGHGERERGSSAQSGSYGRRESDDRRPRRDDGDRSPRRDDRPRRDNDRDAPPVDSGPKVPEGADYAQLDVEARAGLRSLPKSLAELIGKHLVAAGMLIDEDPQRALVHARYARERASRVAIVREAAGLTAYHAGEWAEALSELRAVRRMSGGNTHIAVMADCERALGRPERALELAKEAGSDLPPEVAVELRIVSAGARRDMEQLDAAVVALQGPDLDPKRRDPWSARLFYAYADNLEAAGRADDAIRWFLNAAQADDDEETDAAERAFALGADESEVAAVLPGEPIEVDDEPVNTADEPNADIADAIHTDDIPAETADANPDPEVSTAEVSTAEIPTAEISTAEISTVDQPIR